MKVAGLISFALRHKAALVAAVVAAGALVLGAGRLLEGSPVEVEPVAQRDFVQTVVASGHVENPHRVEIGAQVTGTVASVPVAEGQSVDAGTVLVTLDDAEAKATVLQAETAVAQAEARLRQLREVQAPVAEQTVRQAQVNLENAQAQAARNQELFAKGFIGQAALDDSMKTARLAEAQLRSAQKQLETTRPSGSDTAVAQAALAQARASAAAARARLAYTAITAPAAGTLIRRDVEVGDVVQPGRALMVLSPAGQTQLVVQVDEKNLRLIAPGQHALASADAYPQQRFAAEVAYVNPGVNLQTGAVEVKLAVPDPPQTLRQDMTVSVDIEVARAAHALLVRCDAVRDADSSAPWVLTVNGGRARRQPVTFGLRGGGLCQVTAGLAAGDLVVTATSPPKEGARLRPVPASHR